MSVQDLITSTVKGLCTHVAVLRGHERIEPAMSTKRARASRRRRRRQRRTEEPPPPPPPPPPTPQQRLPQELLLEIIARADDAATFLRCAATSKPIRRAIVAERRAAASGRRFCPSLLLGVSYASHECGGDAIVGPSWGLRFDASILRSFEPVSERDGLLVLWRREDESELLVCDTCTGRVTSLPGMDPEHKWGNGGIYRPAFLAVGGAAGRRSFELLAMDACLRARVFSSETGEWNAARIVKPPPRHSSWCFVYQRMGTSPSVIRRIAYWVCSSPPEPAIPGGNMFILSLHAEAARCASIELPQGCHGRVESCTLSATANGKLSVVVADTEAMSVWTRSSAAWSRQAVISKRCINMQVAPGAMDADRTIWFMGFGERSGTVIFWIDRVGLVQLHLGTRRAVLLCRCGDRDIRAFRWAWLREIDMASLLQGMKPF
ncbi:hypothetical protein ACP70R_025542 [Stipagrostis hirtigluma subsp. patula]